MKNSFSEIVKNLRPTGLLFSNADMKREAIMAELSKMDRLIKKLPKNQRLARYCLIECKLLLINELERLSSSL